MIFNIFRKLGAAEAKAEIYKADAEVLRTRVKELEDEKARLLEWFLGLNGMAAPSRGAKDSATLGHDPKDRDMGDSASPYSSAGGRHHDVTPTQQHNFTQARDWKNHVEGLEREALGY